MALRAEELFGLSREQLGNCIAHPKLLSKDDMSDFEYRSQNRLTKSFENRYAADFYGHLTGRIMRELVDPHIDAAAELAERYEFAVDRAWEGLGRVLQRGFISDGLLIAEGKQLEKVEAEYKVAQTSRFALSPEELAYFLVSDAVIDNNGPDFKINMLSGAGDVLVGADKIDNAGWWQDWLAGDTGEWSDYVYDRFSEPSILESELSEVAGEYGYQMHKLGMGDYDATVARPQEAIERALFVTQTDRSAFFAAYPLMNGNNQSR
jgi:hypothetical protein